MNVTIYGREAVQKLINEGFPENTAVISFYDPLNKKLRSLPPVDYSAVTNRVFQIALNDIDYESLGDYGFTYETYFTEAVELSEFIYDVKKDGYDIICQCEYGYSRSSGCAAAIREHFSRDGIKVFADYRYCPNQLVYNKVYNALVAEDAAINSREINFDENKDNVISVTIKPKRTEQSPDYIPNYKAGELQFDAFLPRLTDS